MKERKAFNEWRMKHPEGIHIQLLVVHPDVRRMAVGYTKLVIALKQKDFTQRTCSSLFATKEAVPFCKSLGLTERGGDVQKTTVRHS